MNRDERLEWMRDTLNEAKASYGNALVGRLGMALEIALDWLDEKDD